MRERLVMRLMLLKVSLAFAVMYSVTACNTIEGIGKDVERAGEKVQDAAKKK
jgi:predicted small secreted protein